MFYGIVDNAENKNVIINFFLLSLYYFFLIFYHNQFINASRKFGCNKKCWIKLKISGGKKENNYHYVSLTYSISSIDRATK